MEQLQHLRLCSTPEQINWSNRIETKGSICISTKVNENLFFFPKKFSNSWRFAVVSCGGMSASRPALRGTAPLLLSASDWKIFEDCRKRSRALMALLPTLPSSSSSSSCSWDVLMTGAYWSLLLIPAGFQRGRQREGRGADGATRSNGDLWLSPVGRTTGERMVLFECSLVC